MRVYIIAEAGVNHNGSIEIAKQMVDQAKRAEADCIKFQTFIARNTVSRYASKADYQKLFTNSNESQLDMVKKLELSFADFVELNTYCKQKEIDFLSTAFDEESLLFLNTLNMKMWKIPSGEITNLPYLIKAAQLNKPIILSTGMCTMPEVKRTVSVLKQYGAAEIIVLHCTTEYPAPYEDVNLSAINTLKQELNLSVGYSDHTEGIEVSIAAAAMGAAVIEKHFTLSRNMEGPDHQASLEPDQLKEMIKCIRHIELAMGDGNKAPMTSEMKNIDIARKSIVAKKDIVKGEIFSEETITVKRPGNGISPMLWFDVIGKEAVRDFSEDELIELN